MCAPPPPPPLKKFPLINIPFIFYKGASSSTKHFKQRCKHFIYTMWGLCKVQTSLKKTYTMHLLKIQEAPCFITLFKTRTKMDYSRCFVVLLKFKSWEFYFYKIAFWAGYRDTSCALKGKFSSGTEFLIILKALGNCMIFNIKYNIVILELIGQPYFDLKRNHSKNVWNKCLINCFRIDSLSSNLRDKTTHLSN